MTSLADSDNGETTSPDSMAWRRVYAPAYLSEVTLDEITEFQREHSYRGGEMPFDLRMSGEIRVQVGLARTYKHQTHLMWGLLFLQLCGLNTAALFEAKSGSTDVAS